MEINEADSWLLLAVKSFHHKYKHCTLNLGNRGYTHINSAMCNVITSYKCTAEYLIDWKSMILGGKVLQTLTHDDVLPAKRRVWPDKT